MDVSVRDRELSEAFALIDAGAVEEAGVFVDRVLAADPNDPYGLLAWGQMLVHRGEIDSAVQALETAARFAPLDPEVAFALADGLVRRAETESIYFRGPTWAHARQAVEHGLYLDPESTRGHRILHVIGQRQAEDAEETQDNTPMEMLPQEESKHLRVRVPRETHPAVRGAVPLLSTVAFWRSLWLLPALVFLVLRFIWSGISSAFTWTNVIVTVALLYGSLVVFRAWLGPRMVARRRQISF